MAILAITAGTIFDIAAGGKDFYLACGICIAALVLFVGLIYHAVAIRPADHTTDGIRDAIACAFLGVYLVLVIYTVFFSNAPKNTAIYPQTSSLLSSFTTVAAIVVGFYFGTGTVDKYIERQKVQDAPTTRSGGPARTPEKQSEAGDDGAGKLVERGQGDDDGSVDLVNAADGEGNIDQISVN